MSGPWTFDQARAAQRDATQKQEQAEEFVKDAYKKFAEAERQFRQAFSEEITKAKASGIAVTFCKEYARGTERVANLEYAKNVAEGVKEAAGQAVWRATADRKTVEGLMQWSMRRDLAEGFAPPAADTDYDPPIGARR